MINKLTGVVIACIIGLSGCTQKISKDLFEVVGDTDGIYVLDYYDISEKLAGSATEKIAFYDQDKGVETGVLETTSGIAFNHVVKNYEGKMGLVEVDFFSIYKPDSIKLVVGAFANDYTIELKGVLLVVMNATHTDEQGQNKNESAVWLGYERDGGTVLSHDIIPGENGGLRKEGRAEASRGVQRVAEYLLNSALTLGRQNTVSDEDMIDNYPRNLEESNQ